MNGKKCENCYTISSWSAGKVCLYGVCLFFHSDCVSMYTLAQKATFFSRFFRLHNIHQEVQGRMQSIIYVGHAESGGERKRSTRALVNCTHQTLVWEIEKKKLQLRNEKNVSSINIWNVISNFSHSPESSPSTNLLFLKVFVVQKPKYFNAKSFFFKQTCSNSGCGRKKETLT